MSTPEPGTTPIIKTDADLRAAAEERVKAKQSFKYQVALFAALSIVLHRDLGRRRRRAFPGSSSR